MKKNSFINTTDVANSADDDDGIEAEIVLSDKVVVVVITSTAGNEDNNTTDVANSAVIVAADDRITSHVVSFVTIIVDRTTDVSVPSSILNYFIHLMRNNHE